jgi:hypothetical protein
MIIPSGWFRNLKEVEKKRFICIAPPRKLNGQD